MPNTIKITDKIAYQESVVINAKEYNLPLAGVGCPHCLALKMVPKCGTDLYMDACSDLPVATAYCRACSRRVGMWVVRRVY
jgi:hypothetical protein